MIDNLFLSKTVCSQKIANRQWSVMELKLSSESINKMFPLFGWHILTVDLVLSSDGATRRMSPTSSPCSVSNENRFQFLESIFFFLIYFFFFKFEHSIFIAEEIYKASACFLIHLQQ